MPGPNDEKCSKCYWFEYLEGVEGKCHGSVPQYQCLESKGKQYVYEWPKVTIEDFCPGYRSTELDS